MPGGWCLFALSLPVMIMVKVWQKKFAQALWAGSGDGPGHLGSEVAFHRQPGKPHTQTHTDTHKYRHRHGYKYAQIQIHTDTDTRPSLFGSGGVACHWKSRNPLS